MQRGYANLLIALRAVRIVGYAIIFGFTRLALLIDTDKSTAGVVPFLLAETLKIALAVAASRAVPAKR